MRIFLRIFWTDLAYNIYASLYNLFFVGIVNKCDNALRAILAKIWLAVFIFPQPKKISAPPKGRAEKTAEDRAEEESISPDSLGDMLIPLKRGPFNFQHLLEEDEKKLNWHN